MSLDLFDGNMDDAVNYAARVSAPELPSTFEDNIADAWSRGRLVESSVSGSLRKSRALSDYMDEVTAKSGTSLQMGETVDGFPSIGEMAVKVREIKAANPNVDIADLSDEEIQRRADEIGVRQIADSEALDRRERTTGGSVGSFLGTAGAAVIDPVNLIAFPLAAPTSLGILGTALAWGGIGAGSQTVIEALNASNMERIQPGYGASGEMASNIMETAIVGGALGGGLKGLSNLWSRAKTGQWPRTVRDAGNVIDSEVQIAGTNPLPGVEGEATHRTALNKAIDNIANGRPVDVDGIVPDNLVQHIEAYHGSPHDFERFDTSKIGSGEGAQAYGHGLYFAESADVARSYQEKLGLSRLGSVADALPDYYRPGNIIEGYGGRDRVIEFKTGDDPWDFMVKVQGIDAEGNSVGRPRWHSTVPSAKDIERVTGKLPGSLYNVRITANKDHMLDLDKPISEQKHEVRQALTQLSDEVRRRNVGNYFSRSVRDGDVPASRAYDDLAQELKGKDAASKALHDAGIPGIRYLDQSSRDAGDGTYNFVVFDDKNVQITHKNGKPVNAEIRQSVVDQAAGLPPKQPELGLAPPEPAKPPGPNVEAVNALRDELTPAKIEEARVNPDMEETVARDLDKLMLERGSVRPEPQLVVARKMPDGTIKVGKAGEVHSDLMTAREVNADGPTPAGIEASMGYADRSGNFLDRKQALDFAARNEPARAAHSLEQPQFGLEAATYNEATPTKGADFEVPMGVTVDAEGRTVPKMVKVEDVVAEADARLAAAKEIADCVGPYPAETAA